jgi:hypothetical protein
MLKICRILQISSINCDNYKRSLGFCIHMIRTYHKVCIPGYKHIYFKEYDSEPCDFVFSEYLDYIYN